MLVYKHSNQCRDVQDLARSLQLAFEADDWDSDPPQVGEVTDAHIRNIDQMKALIPIEKSQAGNKTSRDETGVGVVQGMPYSALEKVWRRPRRSFAAVFDGTIQMDRLWSCAAPNRPWIIINFLRIRRKQRAKRPQGWLVFRLYWTAPSGARQIEPMAELFTSLKTPW